MTSAGSYQFHEFIASRQSWPVGSGARPLGLKSCGFHHGSDMALCGIGWVSLRFTQPTVLFASDRKMLL
jgi:hypothetical protein